MPIPIAYIAGIVVCVGLTAYIIYHASQQNVLHTQGGYNTSYQEHDQDLSLRSRHRGSSGQEKCSRRRRRGPSGQEKCLICLDLLTELDEKLPCKHIFHKSCIQGWFKLSRTCPNCHAPQQNVLHTQGGYNTSYQKHDQDLSLRSRHRGSSGQEKCSICLDLLTELDEKLPCKHIFHKSCIQGWFKLHRTCPNCREYAG